MRPEETASGMSIDRAWRYTIGDPSVLIAVTDSGIEWDERDLVDRHFLNAAELANYVPTGPNGEACGGTGELAGFDCFPVGAPDGVLTVSDYQFSDGLLSPPADAEHPLGDANRNGILDPEDLIINFSDGTDDDGNGYVDDISGWDFAKDDNNPYDDTRDGHGTGEAKDSTAEANNGIGTAGNCPQCRVLSLRVGDSFIGDVNAFGQAVVYATDMGVQVVQCALGTVNMNTFAQQALDYAYAQGVLNVTSMADENSRHHNVPAAANHTLPVHAIHYRPDDYQDVESWLAYNPCTNYGGQNMLSVSGEACSSEAVGQLSGIAGLLFSAARQLSPPLSPPLAPAEAMQLLITTADDIDIPASREPLQDSFQWSQAGFDQRFGYGRVNANAMVEALRAGRIPPAIDVTNPTWFQVLYPQRRQGPVEIQGRIETRAPSYDYVVEWAPGVQPRDEAFTEIVREENLPKDEVAGAEGPLALLDVRTIDPTHEWDVDSPLGENQYTITVRIRAIAHYGGDTGDVPGELRRTYYVHEDPDLKEGFPVQTGASGEGSPKMADINGDGVLDLVVPSSDGRIHVYDLSGDEARAVDGFPFVGSRVDGLASPPVDGKPNYLDAPGYEAEAPSAPGASVDPRRAGSAFINAPAVADLDGDGLPEIVATSWNGFIYVIEHDGTLKAGFPLRLPEVPSCPTDGTEPAGPCTDTQNLIDRGAYASPVLVDMDADGNLDIVQAAFDGKVYVFDRDGTPVDGWPVTIAYDGDLSPTPKRARVVTTPAAADFDGDGRPELVVGSNEQLGDGGDFGAFYLVDGRGTAAGEAPWRPGWPVTFFSQEVLPLVGEGTSNPAAIARFGDTLGAVAYGNGSLPRILPDNPGGQDALDGPVPNHLPVNGADRGLSSLSRFGLFSEADNDVMLPLFSTPALGDVDQDGTPDVVVSGSSLSLANSLAGTELRGQHLVNVWSGVTGLPLPGAPFRIEDYSFFNSQAVADLDGDAYPEVIAGSGGYYLHAWDGCGREPAGWPKFTGQWIIATPAVGDVDGDGKLEVAVQTRSGWLYVWDTEGKADGVVAWGSKHHDNRNTGNYETDSGVGGPTLQAAEPLTAALCEATNNPPVPPRLSPGGGCNCRMAPVDRDDDGPLALGVLLAGLAMARRRRRGHASYVTE